MLRRTVLDLFCGCGGMSWGLARQGFDIVAGIDTCSFALDTFRLNLPESVGIDADLTTLDPIVLEKLLCSRQKNTLDCIVGGPPCQGFSKNVPAQYRFLGDPRNQLFKEFLRFVDYFRPKVVVIENVAEIYNAYGGAVREEILSSLDGFGYSAVARVVNAADYGVPQRRRRCLFLASKTGVAPVFPAETNGVASYEQELFSTYQPYVSAWNAISDLPAVENGDGHEPASYACPPQNDYQRAMRARSEIVWDHVARSLRPKQLARVQSLAPGEAFHQLPPDLQPKSGYSGAYGRLDFESVAPTITRWVFHPGSGRYCHPREARLLTIREVARIQSFSDDFRFSGTYVQKAAQLGNAVPPLLMERLAPILNRMISAFP